MKITVMTFNHEKGCYQNIGDEFQFDLRIIDRPFGVAMSLYYANTGRYEFSIDQIRFKMEKENSFEIILERVQEQQQPFPYDNINILVEMGTEEEISIFKKMDHCYTLIDRNKETEFVAFIKYDDFFREKGLFFENWRKDGIKVKS
jgi:hypothetical protein